MESTITDSLLRAVFIAIETPLAVSQLPVRVRESSLTRVVAFFVLFVCTLDLNDFPLNIPLARATTPCQNRSN